MLILADTANPTQIEKALQFYPLDGVTTNPSLIAREKKEFFPLLGTIRDIIGEEKMLHVQVTGSTWKEMVEEAIHLKEKISGNLYIKIPVLPEGLKAMGIIKSYNINVTATAVFTPLQALLAAKAGADYIAPYVNRLDNLCSDGVAVVEEILNVLAIYNFNGKVIAASFKNVEQINRLCQKGVHCVTLSPQLIEQSLFHPMTDVSIEGFKKDWENCYGLGTKITDFN